MGQSAPIHSVLWKKNEKLPERRLGCSGWKAALKLTLQSGLMIELNYVETPQSANAFCVFSPLAIINVIQVFLIVSMTCIP
ncbi:hypothetical protein OESDEN_21155 [Oesophagostomum dentatum]|uniref:Uncharacterized protein n=1 Tax=Oesophagostomum dentatum TaxID=61180 RepID=A0A0B1S7N3_OESDE|nr:hypothetical protein OESDEN_21155 [Oesophagostomum dentatum]